MDTFTQLIRKKVVKTKKLQNSDQTFLNEINNRIKTESQTIVWKESEQECVCCGVLYMQKRSVSHQQDQLTICPSTRVLTIHLPHWMLMSSLLRQQVSLRGRKVIWGVGWCGRSAFVCLGWRGVTALDLKEKKKRVWSRRGWGWRCAVALFVQAQTCSCYTVTLRCFSFNRNDIFVLLLF